MLELQMPASASSRAARADVPRAARPADATAAHLLVSVPVVSIDADAHAAHACALASPETRVYVVESSGVLAGVLRVSALLALRDTEAIAPHLEPAPISVREETDQEHVALVAVRNSLSAVPVCAADRRFVGVVPAATLLRVLHDEHVEDFDRFSGVLRQAEHVVRALDDPPSRRVVERLPWLLVGLVGSALATLVVAHFEAALERRLAVAFFIPGIVYLADAIGTQTEAIAVRGLSHHHLEIARVFLGELRTGFLLGLALAAPVLPLIGWIFHDFALAAAVALAILVAGTIATVVGFMFPLLLARRDKDPALGSGPLATVVQDVLSLVAYFIAVQLLLA